jgi:uncharacterized protein YeaO (DUF488 family)
MGKIEGIFLRLPGQEVAMTIELKRAYDPPEATDGERLLVDRLWPRGLRKEAAHLSAWLKELAPSEELRRWFAHDPSRWLEFQERYRAELRAPEKRDLMRQVAEKALQGKVTLVFAAHDISHNNAVILKAALEQYLKEHKVPPDISRPQPRRD